MLLGQIFQSIQSWQKLSAIPMRAKIAYAILKYSALVSDEHALAEKQRVALIHEITKTADGEDAKIEPGSPEFAEYIEKVNAVMTVEADLKPLDVDFSEVVAAVDEKDESLSVQDLALLEVFFADYKAPEAAVKSPLHSTEEEDTYDDEEACFSPA